MMADVWHPNRAILPYLINFARRDPVPSELALIALVPLGIGIIIHVPYTATNQLHKFEVYLLDADGQELPLGDAPEGAEESDGKIRRWAGQFNVGRPPTLQPGDEQLVPLAVNIDGLVFDRADAYRFVIELDGSREKSLPFRVYHVVQPGAVAS
jgi:hypothetical protein